MITPNRGVRLSVDVGTQRIGLAKSDQDQIMAVPVTTIAANENAISSILDLVADLDAQLIYVGKPISLNSKTTESTKIAIDFAFQLANSTHIPVHLIDERFTTVSATSQLQKSGKDSRHARLVIDQVAAVILLDQAMAIEKSSGSLAGELIMPKGIS